jgi:hypothetical protein
MSANTFETARLRAGDAELRVGDVSLIDQH